MKTETKLQIVRIIIVLLAGAAGYVLREIILQANK